MFANVEWVERGIQMPLKSQMQSNDTLRRINEDEGLGWALDAFHPEDIKDITLRRLWDDARDAMELIRDYLETAPTDEVEKPVTRSTKVKDDPSKENQSYRRPNGTWHAATFKKEGY